MSATTPIISHDPAAAPSDTRAPGRRLVLGRILWLAVAAFSVSVLAAGLAPTWHQLHTACRGPSCTAEQLTPAQAQTLHAVLGLTPGTYALFAFSLSVASACLWVSVGVFLWRKLDQRIVLVLALQSIAQGVNGGNGRTRGLVDVLTQAHSPWLVPALFLIAANGILLFFFFALFPTGQFVPRWMRWVGVCWLAFGLLDFLWRLSSPLHADLPPLVPAFLGVLLLLAIAQVYRYLRVSTGLERQQTKWVVFGFIGVNLVQLGTWLPEAVFAPLRQPDSLYDPLATQFALLSFLFFPVSTLIAILRYRLWDIDLLINRTLVYGLLTASVLGIYVLVVGGLGAAFAHQANLAIALVATGLVAVLFQPLRARLQRGVNRLLYGQRDEPYAVLSRLGRRLEATLAPEAVLTTIVETVAQALKLPYAAITLKHGEAFTPAATFGRPQDQPIILPLVYHTETIGQLRLSPRAPGDVFTAADRRLLEDLAHQAGVAVHAVRLTTDLQHARERLVTAREEERRRLRRDLHDGLGPQLAGLTLKLETARNRLAHDPLAETLLADLAERTQATVADIRRLVYALRPPALDELGLLSALHALTVRDSAQLSTHLEAPASLPELPAAVEVALYRIAQEALTNVVRHAQARHCTLRLTLDEPTGWLALSILDDGAGLPAARGVGVGLRSMRERAEELGGTCLVQPGERGGTRVLARVPYAHSETGDISVTTTSAFPLEEE